MHNDMVYYVVIYGKSVSWPPPGKDRVMNITVKLLEAQEVEPVGSLFKDIIYWGDTTPVLKGYFNQQLKGERVILLGYSDKDFAGYVTIMWQSEYPPFAEKGVPEINDLRVLPAFRRRGVASALMDEAEKRVFERSPVVGIGVGVYAAYGVAQRMYVRRGYVPDGRGLYYKTQPVKPWQDVHVDDDLILYLIKERSGEIQ